MHDFVRSEAFTFDLAFGFDSAMGLEKGKSHVERVLDHFSIAVEQVWFVGDSLTDGLLAQACGVRFVARVGTFSRSTFEARFPEVRCIDELDELERLIDEGAE